MFYRDPLDFNLNFYVLFEMLVLIKRIIGAIIEGERKVPLEFTKGSQISCCKSAQRNLFLEEGNYLDKTVGSFPLHSCRPSK